MKYTKFTFQIAFAIMFIMLSWENQIKAQEYIQAMKNMSLTEAQHVKRLFEEIQPTIYLTNAEMKQYGNQSPSLVVCDAKSFQKLYLANNTYQFVEAVRINISEPNDLSYSLDLANLQSFASLKYLYIVFQFDVCGNQSMNCIESHLKSIVKNKPEQVKLLFSLDIIE